MMAKYETITEETIALLMDRFYTKVRADELLGPVFNAAIGTTDEFWIPHLAKISRFWATLLLGTKTYVGNPFQKHLDLPPFDLSLFDRWLSLFRESVLTIFSEEPAQRFIERSQLIAEGMRLGLQRNRGDDQ